MKSRCGIPRLLPVSTKYEPPTLEYIKSFIPKSLGGTYQEKSGKDHDKLKKGYKLSVLKGVHQQGTYESAGPKFGSIQRFDFDEFENAYELDSQRKANLKESWKDYDSKYKQRHHPSQFGS